MQEAILLPCDINMFYEKACFTQINKKFIYKTSPRFYGIILFNVWYV